LRYFLECGGDPNAKDNKDKRVLSLLLLLSKTREETPVFMYMASCLMLYGADITLLKRKEQSKIQPRWEALKHYFTKIINSTLYNFCKLEDGTTRQEKVSLSLSFSELETNLKEEVSSSGLDWQSLGRSNEEEEEKAQEVVRRKVLDRVELGWLEPLQEGSWERQHSVLILLTLLRSRPTSKPIDKDQFPWTRLPRETKTRVCQELFPFWISQHEFPLSQLSQEEPVEEEMARCTLK
jgi:hypothetical protein